MPRILVRALLLLIAGCGRVDFEARSDAALIDAPFPTTAFSAPFVVGSLSDPGFDDDPTLTGDLLEIYFSSSRTGSLDPGGDIWTARRASPDDPWGDPALVAELSSTFEDQSPGITADGLTIYFTSRRPAAGNSDFWVSTRADRTSTWSPPVLVAELSTTLDEFEPQPDPSHLRLVLYRQMNTNRTLFEATRASTASPWSMPAAITELDTAGSERSPCLADGGRQILFGADRTTPDVHDLYLAVRPSVGEPFGAPSPLVEVNSPMDDDDPWLSPDGHLLVFSSTRSGNSEIWEARR